MIQTKFGPVTLDSI